MSRWIQDWLYLAAVFPVFVLVVLRLAIDFAGIPVPFSSDITALMIAFQATAMFAIAERHEQQRSSEGGETSTSGRGRRLQYAGCAILLLLLSLDILFGMDFPDRARHGWIRIGGLVLVGVGGLWPRCGKGKGSGSEEHERRGN